MNRGLVLVLILLAILAASLWFAVKDDDQSLLEGIQKGLGAYKTTAPSAPAPTDSSSGRGSAVPAEFQSGKSRFSQGTCAQDSDCTPGGCSGEVCSSSGDVVSTCEYSDSFPSAKKYSCSCLSTKVCGWE